jgi:hypothetical protein
MKPHVPVLVILSVAAATLAAQTSPESMTISGRILSAATARPVPGARATASVADYQLTAATDGEGRFEIAVREPGRYRINAAAPGYLTGAFGDEPEIGQTLVAVERGQHVEHIDIKLHRGGTIAGTVIDDFKDPVVSGTVRAFRRTIALGEARFIPAGDTRTDDRGIYRLIGLPPGQYIVGLVDQSTVMFSPNAPNPAGATQVSLGVDEEREKVNIQIRPNETGSIDGLVTGPGAGSPRMTVQLVPDPNPVQLPPQATRIQPGSRFAFSSVPAGRYRLMVAPDPSGQPPRSWGIAPVFVAPDRTTTASITVRDEPMVTGTVEAVGVRRVTIRLSAIHGEAAPSIGSIQTRADPVGPFSLGPVPPGRYGVQVLISNSDLLPESRLARIDEPGTHRLLGSVRIGDIDVTDRGLDMTDKPIDNVRVTVTPTAARISGTVLDSDGRPTSAGAIVVVSTDRRDWTATSRRIQVTRADTDGVFHVPLLPPGRYRVAHVTTLEPGQIWDPAFLASLPGAREVTATAGTATTLQIRLK